MGRAPSGRGSFSSATPVHDLVADLRGQFRIILTATSTRSAGRASCTRFFGLPDAPVTRFQMNLFGGRWGLIENSRNLCATRPRVEIRLQGQNGRKQVTKPKIALSCGKRAGSKGKG